ncbi:LOW QUALITY PROTEIN: uncharacterized protein RCH25_004395 [Pelodytes ibericus]
MSTLHCLDQSPDLLELSEDKRNQAEEAKERTLSILTDALRKKDHVLVEKPEDLSDYSWRKDIPRISPALVNDLICELKKVTFKRGESKQNWIAFVYPESTERVIYLCPPFWKKKKHIGINSRLGTIIHEVSHFLGYAHSLAETSANNMGNRFHHRNLLPLTNYDIASAFEENMSHCRPYKRGAYSCCGERSRDSVCDRSQMIIFLQKTSPLSEDESKQAEEAKQRTLNILNDALKKKDSLLLENPEDINPLYKVIPFISPSLVQDMICELQKVTFRRGCPDHGDTTIAYVYPQATERIIYLCPLFWEEDKFWGLSRPGTIIHEVGHFLGYQHTVGETMANRMNGNSNLLALTNYDMSSAFTIYMDHSQPYKDGAYGCCSETSRDTVCEKSFMSFSKVKIMKIINGWI